MKRTTTVAFLLVLAVLFALPGCSTRHTVAYESVVRVCPAQLMPSTCPAFPDKGKTLRELLIAWEKAKAGHVQCAVYLQAWKSTWQACAD